MQKPNKEKLGMQISKTIAMVFLVIAVVYSVIIYSAEYSSFDRTIRLVKISINSIFEQRKDEIANEMFLDHKSATSEIINKIKEIDGVVQISLYTKDGTIFDSTEFDSKKRLNVFKHLELASPLFEKEKFDDKSVLVYTTPIVVIGELFGFIRIYYEIETIEQEFLIHWLLFISVLVASLFLMAYVLNLKLKKLVTDPVKIISSAMHRIEEGDLGLQVDLDADNEIGQMAESFNLMSCKNKMMYDDLGTLNQDLEKKVEERTCELNRQLMETKRAQNALEDSERRFRELFNNMTSGVVIYESTDGGKSFIIRDINHMCERIERVKRENIIGKDVRDVFPGVEKTGIIEKFQEVYRFGRMVEMEAFFYHDDLRCGWRKNYIYRLPDKEIVAVYNDVTSEKENERRLEDLNKDLQRASLQAGMAEVASEVLHNVGNVLNSVNISASSIRGITNKLKADSFEKAVGMLKENCGRLDDFLHNDPKGKQLISYFDELQKHLYLSQEHSMSEIGRLQENIEHINEIINMQQNYAKECRVEDVVDLQEMVEDALRLNEAAFVQYNIRINKDYATTRKAKVQKHKVLQIITNLITNAKDALVEADGIDKHIYISIRNAGDKVEVSVKDNGIGIEQEHLTRIFAHGYTTKKHGHGFGLHGSAIAAMEMGGNLDVVSEGKGKGAEFILTLPAYRK